MESAMHCIVKAERNWARRAENRNNFHYCLGLLLWWASDTTRFGSDYHSSVLERCLSGAQRTPRQPSKRPTAQSIMIFSQRDAVKGGKHGFTHHP
ncbi:MAG: hypothetical protein UY19_C0010G0027 [Candidatus Wolfebacteria bacterium GW2011_GWA2_47_9b]|uniref:Uncharacterized protein n=1 Tax=Candidatus Wolfebacteria bacterium GW2011_GWA2_47_9b TaxID=1619005 RepID=A0A0G1U6K1_9BACT|nr:MAG: hypothetical protein UY19_C0010G0027 [Candidatus Wolfebacteria bacterium GW2011_GWA2_47_9b]